MAAPDPGGYRNKYMLALKEQERLERQLTVQTDLLKKTMLQLGTAASGMDQQLDASVQRLREAMRGGSGANVIEQMERVQASVELFEGNRIQENSKAASVMSRLVDQYLELQIPADIKTSLKSFSKSLQKRLSNFRQYPIALEDLAKLQHLALEAASNPSAGLWQRIKGGKTLDQADTGAGKGSSSSQVVNEASKSTKDSNAGEHESKEGLENQRAGEANDSKAELSLDITGDKSASHPEDKPLRARIVSSLGDDDEENYEVVASRIAKTLANLVEKIEPNDAIKHRVDIVRMRIERGMDWYVLAVTLEDIRDILFLRYLQADHEFSAYLNQVNMELGTIRRALAGASEKESAQSLAVNELSDKVSSGVDRIRHSVKETEQVDQLKTEVTDHINYITDALKEFKASPKNSVSDQLHALMAQIKSIEHESQQTKEALEEQRHKATHDALTGLPNREAYADRAFQEFERFKRYKRSLVIAVCDIDFFKKINDNFGHQAGDKVLKLIATVISTRLRNVDFIARYGGEEFVILMPETEIEQAFKVLDKIRAAVGKTPFRFKEKPVQITISFGLSTFLSDDTVESAFERADKALYKAKADGRDRCIIDQSAAETKSETLPKSTDPTPDPELKANSKPKPKPKPNK